MLPQIIIGVMEALPSTRYFETRPVKPFETRSDPIRKTLQLLDPKLPKSAKSPYKP